MRKWLQWIKKTVPHHHYTFILTREKWWNQKKLFQINKYTKIKVSLWIFHILNSNSKIAINDSLRFLLLSHMRSVKMKATVYLSVFLDWFFLRLSLVWFTWTDASSPAKGHIFLCNPNSSCQPPITAADNVAYMNHSTVVTALCPQPN